MLIVLPLGAAMLGLGLLIYARPKRAEDWIRKHGLERWYLGTGSGERLSISDRGHGLIVGGAVVVALSMAKIIFDR